MVQKPSGLVLASLKTEGDGKVFIRSHVIEASGSSEAWYVPPQPLAVALLDEHFHSSSKMLLIDSIKLLNHLLSEIDRVLVVDHDLDRLLAAFVDDESDSAFFRDRLCGNGDFLHILVN